MKKFKRSLVIVSSIIVFVCMQSSYAIKLRAEDGGWSWGPFASSTKTSDATSSDSSSRNGSSLWTPKWKVPDVTGGIQRTGRAFTDKTSAAWNSTTRATRKAWKKTTEVLDPFPDKEQTTLNPSPWAAGGSNAKKSSSGGFSSWFSSKEPEIEKPSTPQDFLRQDRP